MRGGWGCAQIPNPPPRTTPTGGFVGVVRGGGFGICGEGRLGFLGGLVFGEAGLFGRAWWSFVEIVGLKLGPQFWKIMGSWWIWDCGLRMG